jgi:hypothetical protein
MELVPKAEFSIVTRASSSAWIPELIAAAGPEVTETYIDFFTSTIRKEHFQLFVALVQCIGVSVKGSCHCISMDQRKLAFLSE